MEIKNFTKIKLHFTGFIFKNCDKTSIGTNSITIMFLIGKKWIPGPHKCIRKKITLKDKDYFDLNKAYRILQTKIETEAYKWAEKTINDVINDTLNHLNVYNEFISKAKNAIEHNIKYLEKLDNPIKTK